MDNNNVPNTLYVGITEGAEEGTMAVDLSNKRRPLAYPDASKNVGNIPAVFTTPDNLALDCKGDLTVRAI